MGDRRLHGAVSGPDVRLLQTTLQDLDLKPGTVDGIYGPRTAAAVRRYQAARELTPDGVVGGTTWERLSSEPGAATAGRRLRTTIVGAIGGPDVREAQEALAAAGFDPGRVDGVYGPDTEAAVLRFQIVHGLRRDGIVGPETRDALLIRRLRLSGTVADLLRRASGPVQPSQAANLILDRHAEYGGGRAASVTLIPEPSEARLSAFRWLARVRGLFQPGAAPELHGRLVLIGLSLVDDTVGNRLSDLLDAVVREVNQPLEALLTSKGRALREQPGAGRSPRLDRLSPSASAAVAYADGLRVALGQDRVHMEHLLGGLFRAETAGPARKLLATLGEDGFAAAVTQAVGTGLPDIVTPSHLVSPPRLSQHAAQAVDSAFRLTVAIDSPQVSSRHLLHGVLSVDTCKLVQALGDRGVHADDVDDWAEPEGFPPAPLARAPLLAGAAADTVPEPGNGRVRAADRLDTAAEVEMLVSVLLAQDTPLPLAVGLFGDWGSGKSFFMALMQERMAELADLAKAGRPEAAPFCREIRQVRFNAWHYVDTNLWASLTATLFDELARDTVPVEAQVKLTELDEAQTRVRQARVEREALEQEARQLETEAQRPKGAAGVATSVAIRAVRDDPDLRRRLHRAAAAGGSGNQSADRLVTALGEVEGVVHKTRIGWRLVEEELLHRRRTTTLLTFLVLVGGAGLVSVVAGWPLLAKAAAVVGAVVASLTPALDGAVRVLYLAREAREARQLPLLQKHEELARARAAEESAEREVAERERELAEFRDRGLRLQQFVRQRAASSDYRGQLGVISKVRRDFEELVALLPTIDRTASAEQVVAVAEAASATVGDFGAPVESSAGALTSAGTGQPVAGSETDSQQVPQVERIILFIDDLDRCPHEKVVEVLQAVHLLLAFRLFVVVVGVDSRWLTRSLETHYRDLLDQPDSYLEKIFQIPFTLRPMTSVRFQELIDDLTPAAADADQSAFAGGPGHPSVGGPTTPALGPTSKAATTSSSGTNPGRSSAPHVEDGRSEPAAAQTIEPEPPLPRPEALVISEPERLLLGRLSRVIPTPRAAKRLVNIYRILRVSVPVDELEAFGPAGGGEYQVVVLLLGVLVGRPGDAEPILRSIDHASDDDDIWQVLGQFDDVYEKLAPFRGHLSISRVEPYRRWARRVSRFSFRMAAVLSEEDDVGPVGSGDRIRR